MSNNTLYEALIFKFLTHNISEEELTILEAWVKKPKNRQIVEDYIKLNHFTNMSIHDFDALRAHHRNEQPTKTIKKTMPIFLKYTAAAVVVGLLAIGYVFRTSVLSDSEITTPIIVNNQIETGTDKATLTLDTGEQVTLEKGTTYQTATVSSNGEEIIYQPKSSRAQSRDIAYNTLTIPRGGQYYMILSDGTKVWLNSESQIKYPVTFTEGKTRQVELIYGEAYFDVSPSTMHNGTDFKVYHKEQEVQVLGTEFNIKAYKDETIIYTTLVEGSVQVRTPVEDQILTPSQQSILDLNNDTMSIALVDANNETIWRKGIFNFKDMSLKRIMKVLSRWYDMDVEILSEEMENEEFVGSFKKSLSIEEILNSIKNTNVINNYEIENKRLIIK